MGVLRELFGRLALALSERNTFDREIMRRRAVFVHITGDAATAEMLLMCAKEHAYRLAAPSPIYTASALLPVLLDEITRRLAAGLPADYVMERVAGLQTVEDLQAMAVVGLLDLVDWVAETA